MTQGNGAHGGYRKPANPALTSGPGQYARRTDGQPVMDMPNAAYGENAAYRSIQQGAPVAGAPGIPSASGATENPLAGLVGLAAPSQQPTVPVTAGAAAGAGPGPDVLGLPMDPQQMDHADAAALRPMLDAMLHAASSPDATPSYRNLVRAVIRNLQ